jgi:predicted dehydrogenase
MKPTALLSGLVVSRRRFLKHALVAGALPGLALQGAVSPNEKIVVGVMGVGGRGSFLAGAFAKRSDVRVAWVCDADQRRLAPAARAVESLQQARPREAQDFRRMLDDKSVDVVVNGTPDHWHVLGSILAFQAGKDVYVEKPMSHNAWEGRKMIEAAARHNRLVQVGMQSRSSLYMQKALEEMRSGRLGDVPVVKVFNVMQHGMSKASSEPAPKEIDMDLWCGPAALQTTHPGYRWLNLYEYSCGPIPGDAIHQLDLARMLMGDPLAPRSVLASGRIAVLKDGRDTPDTQSAIFEYENTTLHLEAALWTPYMKKTPMDKRDKDIVPNWPFNSTRIEVLGTKGFMYVGRHGEGWQVFSAEGELVETMTGRQGDALHIENFLECVRTRKEPRANAAQGHASALLCHLANIACRVGNRKLVFDAGTETFPGEAEANRFLRRAQYRSPWVLPEKA